MASASDQPGTGGSPGLRRSVGEATSRIHEIIDAAERVASDIRADAEAEAHTYLAERRAEADRAAEERSRALDQLTKVLADTAERFKHEAERMLVELDQAIVDARADVYRHGAVTALGDEPELALGGETDREEPAPGEEAEPQSTLDDDPEPALEPVGPERDPLSLESLSREPRRTRTPVGLEPLAPPDEPFELPPLDPDTIERDRPRATVSAYPGREHHESPAPSADRTSEALLRATQLAVTGKDRDEIADVLRTDYPGVDTDPLLDEILG